mmetsp:Transcript_12229/g.25243  ORF Transcript_12229/g.25243 Transcript_12229/m.25243 type:complete len:80 (-) Transcript_12229:1027-1266(-)
MPASGQMVEEKKNKLMLHQLIRCRMVKAARMPLSMEKWLTNNNGGRQNFRTNSPEQWIATKALKKYSCYIIRVNLMYTI